LILVDIFASTILLANSLFCNTSTSFLDGFFGVFDWQHDGARNKLSYNRVTEHVACCMHGKFTPNTKHLQSEQKFSVCTLNPHGLEINPFFVVAKLIQITMFVVCIAFFLKTNLGGTLTANCT